MKKRILVWLTTLMVAITVMFGGGLTAFADTTPDVGVEQWYYYGGGWSDGKTVSPPAYSNGNVYFMIDDGSSTKLMKVAATADGEVTSANSKATTVAEFTGKPLGWGMTAPTVDGTKVYVPFTGGVGIVDATEKNSKYIATESGYQTISPISYDDNYIYAGTWDASGKGKYTRISKSDDSKTVMVDGTADAGKECFYWAGACSAAKDGTSYVMFGSDSGKVYLYNNTTGTLVSDATFTASGKVRSSIVSDGNGNYYFSSYDGKLYKVSIETKAAGGGVEIKAATGWPVTLAGASTCTPVVSGDTVYAGSDSKSVEAFDISTGNKVTGKSNTNMPSDVKNMVLLNGNIYAPNNTAANGGIYDAINNQSYFTPIDKSKREYNIYSIATNGTDMMFFKNDSGYITAVKTASLSKHKITANLIGDGGTLAPAASLYTGDGGSYVFTAKPDNGYKIALAKAVSGSAYVTIDKNNVILDKVKSDVTLEVSFAKTEAKEANVTVTAQSYDDADKNMFKGINKTLRVSSDISQEYGYSDSVSDGVSALDVLITYYKDVLKTPKSGIADALVINRLAFGAAVNKWFGTVGDNTMDFAYAVNYSSGNAIDMQVINDGDRVDFFGYYDENYADVLTWFENSSGKKVNSIKVKEGEVVDLTLKGYQFTAYPTPEPSAIPDVTVTSVGSDGKQSQLDDNLTDDSGKVTLKFTKAGKYTVSAYGILATSVPTYGEDYQVTGSRDVNARLASPAVQVTVVDDGSILGIKTGDDSNIIFFVLIAALALAAGTTVTVISRKRKI